MAELILCYLLKFAMLGLGYYLANKILSKKIKEFHCSIGKDWLKFDGSFYKE